MRKDKYKDPIKREVVYDNIEMEVPDEIATDMAKNNFKKKVTLLRFVMCVLKSSAAGWVFSNT